VLDGERRQWGAASDLSVDIEAERATVDGGMRFPTFTDRLLGAPRHRRPDPGQHRPPEVPMQPTRRHLLHTAGAGGLVGALALLVPDLAAAAPDLEDEQFEELASRWVDQLTGRHLLTSGQSRFEPLIEEIDTDADEYLDLMNPAGSATVFSDLDYAQDPSLTATMRRLAHLATAWATPGSRHHQDTALRDLIITGVRDFRDGIYNPSQPEYGNWWTWEIGVSRALADTMAILREHLTDEDIAALGTSIDFYVPDPWQQFPAERGRITSEGANRVDLCQAVIIRSIVGRDRERLAHAIEGLSAVWQIVDEGNGFYEDGSFIQHSTIGYTGTYGLVLLSGLSKLFALLSGTVHDIDDPSRANLTDAVERSFAPLVHEGRMMDAVRGRAISRERERSLDNGNDAIEAILLLSEAVDEDTAQQWRGLCRGWIEDNASATILDEGPISRLALVSALMDSAVTARRLPPGSTVFPQMDRVVHRGREGWAACLAMCSDRIAWYECGNGENEYGSLTSQGMTYLYLPQDDDHFDDDFWATCDLQGLPGITVDTTPLPPRVEGQWGGSVPHEAEWTGGVALGGVSLVGQHLIAPGDTGLTARKTWLLLEDRIVALGSDIRTDTRAEVKTVIEHRNLGTTGRRMLVDGTEIGADTVEADAARWAHVENVGGYLLLEGIRLRAVQADREGSWSRNSTTGSEELLRRRYATLEAVHSPEDSSYAYVVLPGAGEGTTRAAASDPGAEIVRNDEIVQAVRAGRLLAANFWRPGRVQNLTSHGPASVLLRSAGNTREVSVCDPTHRQDSVSLSLSGTPTLQPQGSNRVTTTRRAGGLDITVDTSGLGGRTVVFTLEP
jgi:hyaluronate lyase